MTLSWRTHIKVKIFLFNILKTGDIATDNFVCCGMQGSYACGICPRMPAPTKAKAFLLTKVKALPRRLRLHCCP
jgi:hypothetical protein